MGWVGNSRGETGPVCLAFDPPPLPPHPGQPSGPRKVPHLPHEGAREREASGNQCLQDGGSVVGAGKPFLHRAHQGEFRDGAGCHSALPSPLGAPTVSA